MAAAAARVITRGCRRSIRINEIPNRAHKTTIREVLLQIENHAYRSFEHHVSLLIVAWTCLAGKAAYFNDVEDIFKFIYRESAKTVLSGPWLSISHEYKRGLARALVQCSDILGKQLEFTGNLCSSLVMTIYDPWGDSAIRSLLVNKEVDEKLVGDFIESEPPDLLLIRIECLVNAGLEECAITLCRACLKSIDLSCVVLYQRDPFKNDKLPFMEFLLRLLFRRGKLNELVADSSPFTCHDGVILIRQIQNENWPESDALVESLINLFLVRDLLFPTNYCCTKELMGMWCGLQVRKSCSIDDVQAGARKLILGHASSSAHFYVFIDSLWEQFGMPLLPLYLELFIRGLTSDLNFLEAARQADARESVIEIENHMAAVYFKLSTLFKDISKDISLECLLSSFSLDPSKEKLDLIKTISLQISVEKSKQLLANKSSKSQTKGRLVSSSCLAPKRTPVITCDVAIQVGESPPMNFGKYCQMNVSYCDSRNESGVQKSVQDESATAVELKDLSVEPQDLSAVAAKPQDLSVATVECQDLSAAAAEPQDLSVAAAKPQDLSIAAVESQDLSETSGEPQDFSLSSVEQQDISVINVEPQNLSTTAVDPQDLSATAVECQNLSVAAAVESQDFSGVIVEHQDFSETVVEPDKIALNSDIGDIVAETLKEILKKCVHSLVEVDLLCKGCRCNAIITSDCCKCNSKPCKELVLTLDSKSSVEPLQSDNSSVNNDTQVNCMPLPKKDELYHDIKSLGSLCHDDFSKSIYLLGAKTMLDSVLESICSVHEKNSNSCGNSANCFKKYSIQCEEMEKPGEDDAVGNGPLPIINLDAKFACPNEYATELVNDAYLRSCAKDIVKDIKVDDHHKELPNCLEINCNGDNVSKENMELNQNHHCVVSSDVGADCPKVDGPVAARTFYIESVANHCPPEEAKNDQNLVSLSNVLQTTCSSGQMNCENICVIQPDHVVPSGPSEVNANTVPNTSPCCERNVRCCSSLEIENSSLKVHNFSEKNRRTIEHKEHFLYNPLKPERAYPFYHIVIDSKIPGVSSSLLADFVIVLESLRNQQLTSTSKWSELKDACREYLDTVSALRCMFLNNQLNGSVDSEEDSSSEITPLMNKYFDSFESDASICDDPNVDKAPLFRRFMNNENNSKFTTFVTLSDIRHPYLRLDRLLCASSSHHEHAKHHRRHKEKVKDPKKLALRQLRHGRNYNHELAKRKKKKKRRGRKEKSHGKKHRSTHNKDNRDLVVSKKKQQRLKKKKESQVDGEYYSDFSSTELMRIVNEHSNSFSQAGASNTVKRTGISASSGSDSDSHLPLKKQRKQVSFKKLKEKKNGLIKSHEKHKHSKNKKLKKRSSNSAQDYSRIVQFSSVKKMQSVQIRRRSVAMDLSNGNEANLPEVNTTSVNGAFQDRVGNPPVYPYSEEDMKKLQMLMAAKQAAAAAVQEDAEKSYGDNMMYSANKQTILKYISSKTTSRMLSVAETSNPSVTPISEQPSTSFLGKPVQFTATQSGKYILTDGSILPISATNQILPSVPAYTVAPRVPVSTTVSPLVTAVALPVAQAVQNPCSRYVGGKLVISLAGGSTALDAKQNLSGVIVSSGNQIYSPSTNLIIVKKNSDGSHTVTTPAQLPKVIPVPAAAIAKVTSGLSTCRKLPVNRTLPNTARKVVKKYIQPTVAKKPVIHMSTVSKPVTPVLQPMSLKSSTASSTRISNQSSTSSYSMASPIKTYSSTSNSKMPVRKEIGNGSSLTVNVLISHASMKANSSSVEENIIKDAKDCVDVLHELIKHVENVVGTSVTSVTSSCSASQELSTLPLASVTKPETSSPISAVSTTENMSVEHEEHTPSEEEEESALVLDIRSPDVKRKDQKTKIFVDGNVESTEVDVSSQNSSSENIVKRESVNETIAEAPADTLASTDVCTDSVSVASPSSVEQEPVDTVESSSSISIPVETITTPEASPRASEKLLQSMPTNVASKRVKTQSVAAATVNKPDGVNNAEVPTRSLTSISDAVRFSLMDMDDATGSVENQVLQTFHSSFQQDGEGYINQTAVTVTENTLTSEASLSVTQSSGTYQTSVNTLQNEAFAECQISTSTAGDWNSGVPSSITDKSMEIDSTSELKDEEKVKRKRKKKERTEKDPEAIQRFWCEICHRGFFSAYNLRRHCRNVHKMDLPKGTSDVPFSPTNTQCLTQVGDRVICSAVSDSSTQAVASQIGNNNQDFQLHSPTAEPKTKEFSHQTSPTSQSKQIQQQVAQALGQSSNYVLHSPPRSTAQVPTSVPISPISQSKEFHLQNVPAVSIGQAQSNFMAVTTTLPKPVPKFQMIQGTHAASQSHALPRMGALQQTASVTSQTVQQTRHVQPQGSLQNTVEIQPSGLVQPLPCQVQQIQQSVQCSLSQNKEAEQRSGMLQAAQEQAIRLARHTAEVQQVQKAMQQFKKTGHTQQIGKADALQQTTTQIQSNAAIAHLQPPILNPQMKKLVQIHQAAALCRSQEFTLQLQGQNAAIDVHTSPMKSPLQYFQTQVSSPPLHSPVRPTLASCAAIRQGQQATQAYVGQQVQGVPNAEFLARIVPHSSQERTSCSQTFPGIATADISIVSGQPHIPIIRQSAEASEGLEDLEQFLLEHMPWGGEQVASQVHSLNRSSTDSVTLVGPVKVGAAGIGQHVKTVSQIRGKSMSSKSKTTKTALSKNVASSKSCTAKKKTCSKKPAELSVASCATSAIKANTCSSAVGTSDMKQCENKSSECQTHERRNVCSLTGTCAHKPRGMCTVEENDSHSSDSVQCIEIMHNPGNIKAAASKVPVNFNALGKQPEAATTCKSVGFCAPTALNADINATVKSAGTCTAPLTQPALNLSATLQPVGSQFIGSRLPSHLNPVEKSSMPNTKEQNVFRFGDSSSIFLNPQCSDGKGGCSSGHCSPQKTTVEAAKKQTDTSCLTKECDQVYAEIPSFYSAASHRDNSDAEKELRDLESKISDCEKQLKNSRYAEGLKNKSCDNKTSDVSDKNATKEAIPAEKSVIQRSCQPEKNSIDNEITKKGVFLGNEVNTSPTENTINQKQCAFNETKSNSSTANKSFNQVDRTGDKSGTAPKGIHFLDEHIEPTVSRSSAPLQSEISNMGSKTECHQQTESEMSLNQQSFTSHVSHVPSKNLNLCTHLEGNSIQGIAPNIWHPKMLNTVASKCTTQTLPISKLIGDSPGSKACPNVSKAKSCIVSSKSQNTQTVNSTMSSTYTKSGNIVQTKVSVGLLNTIAGESSGGKLLPAFEQTSLGHGLIYSNRSIHTDKTPDNLGNKLLLHKPPENKSENGRKDSSDFPCDISASKEGSLNVLSEKFVTDDTKDKRDLYCDSTVRDHMSAETSPYTIADVSRCEDNSQKLEVDGQGRVVSGRTRLRDTPKTSVKRSCPCCTDSCPPKKCRANNSTSNLSSSLMAKVSKVNSTKPNSPQRTRTVPAIKTRIAPNSSAQVKTRSSHRLRTRNGTVT